MDAMARSVQKTASHSTPCILQFSQPFHSPPQGSILSLTAGSDIDVLFQAEHSVVHLGCSGTLKPTGTDLLRAENGGLCLFLQEKCCVYSNKSGIIRNKIQHLQTDLQKHKEQLNSSSPWTFENAIQKWMLPFLTPFLLIFLLLPIAPGSIRFFSVSPMTNLKTL